MRNKRSEIFIIFPWKNKQFINDSQRCLKVSLPVFIPQLRQLYTTLINHLTCGQKFDFVHFL